MNRKIIIVVFVLFTAPVVVATLLHSEWFTWQPGGTRNHGDLVQPVVPLPDFSISTSSGELVDKASLLERWQLVHVRHTPCAETCMEDLYWLRQVRRAQDRHQPDVGLLVISTIALDSDTVNMIKELSPVFQVIDGSQVRALAEVFPGSDQSQASYILDPMANIILGYSADADPNGIRRDLRRLLTWTQRN